LDAFACDHISGFKVVRYIGEFRCYRRGLNRLEFTWNRVRMDGIIRWEKNVEPEVEYSFSVQNADVSDAKAFL
jgi:hypothetical protein